MKKLIDDAIFIHKDIFPVKIVLTNGIVENAKNLLINKTLQISNNEKLTTTLKNSLSTKKASIILDFGKEIHGKVRLLTFTKSAESTA